MTKLFLTLLNIGIKAGWLILAVLLLRVILRKAPRWTVCLLWGVVALRLVFPVFHRERVQSDSKCTDSTDGD